MRESFRPQLEEITLVPVSSLERAPIQEQVDSVSGKERVSRKVLDFLQTEGLLEKRDDGSWVLNTEAIVNSSRLGQIATKRLGRSRGNNRRNLKTWDIVETLMDVSVYDKSQLELRRDDQLGPVERPVIKLPRDKVSALKGDFDNGGLITIDSFDIGRDKWSREIVLDDGSVFNLAELAVAEKMHSLGCYRDEEGVLQMFDKDSDGYVKFGVKRFVELAGIKPRVKTLDEELVFENNASIFAKKYLSRLLEAGTLNERDFSRHSDSKSSEVLGDNRRILRPLLSFYGIRYYIGRTHVFRDEVSAKDTPVVSIPSPTAYTKRLDRSTVGIFDVINGKEKLVYYFPLLDEVEVKALRERTKERLVRDGKISTEAAISQYSIVDAEQMKRLIRPYHVTDFVVQRPGESARRYGEKTANASDVSFVTGGFQKIFHEAGVGMHNLPWSEQLIIADSIMSERNTSRLVSFAKKYGLSGLRTFLSLEHGERELGGGILSLGERLDQHDAQEIFDKYTEIVEVTYKVTDSLRKNFKTTKDYDPAVVVRIQEQLLLKGRKLLEDFARQVKNPKLQNSKLSGDLVRRQLEDIKADTLLFLASFKILKESGADIRLEDIKNTELSSLSASELAQEKDTVKEMRRIYDENYRSKDKEEDETLTELRETLLGGFDKTLTEGSATYYVLKHIDANHKDTKEVVGFYRLEPRPDGTVYFGSFNINPHYRGHQLGEAMMRQTLDRAAERNVLKADCISTYPISGNYIEGGFVALHYDPKYKGMPVLSITRNDRYNSEFVSKFISLGDIKRRSVVGREVQDGNCVLVAQPVSAIDQIPFDLINEEDEEGGHYVLTRYIREKGENGEIIYTVFEKASRATLATYQMPTQVMEEASGSLQAAA